MGTQQFCLKWNNHQTNMLAVFEQLLSSEALVDVTLACDGLSLKAHKMVLSACSPFFQSLFLENPCKHPIVILKDMRYTDLKAIIDFMYRGEVNVSQDQLSALLKTAETLKVKGLAEVTGEQRQGASGVIQQEIVQQTVTTQALPLTSAQQQRAESPPLSRRKRGRPRRRSLSDSNRSDTEDQVPSKIKEPDSPEVVEDISRDGSDVSCEIRQRLSAPNHPQSQVSTHPIPHSSVLSSVSNQKPVTTVSSVQDSQVTVEEPPSGDETEFEMEPSKLMEQSMTTDNVPVFSDGPSQGPSLPPVSNQLAIPTTVGLVDTQPLHTTGPCGDSQALIPCSLPSEPSTSSQLSQDTTQDIKPSALVSYEEPPISPVAGPSHQDSSSSMMMYMETSAIAGPSNYQLDKQSQPHQQSQPQDSTLPVGEEFISEDPEEVCTTTSTQRGQVKLVARGFFYVKDKSTGNRYYWRCESRHCRGRAVTILSSGSHVLKHATPHHHQPWKRPDRSRSAPYVKESSSATTCIGQIMDTILNDCYSDVV